MYTHVFLISVDKTIITNPPLDGSTVYKGTPLSPRTKEFLRWIFSTTRRMLMPSSASMETFRYRRDLYGEISISTISSRKYLDLDDIFMDR